MVVAGIMGAENGLYGGAVMTYIPEGFLDGSLLREVPDTQEVYVNGREPNEQYGDGLGTEESIVVDLLEQVDEPDLERALRTHVAEITTFNGSHSQDREFSRETPVGNHGKACMVVEKNLILCVGLVRWADVDTDVVITVNVPVKEVNGSKQSGALPNTAEAAYRLLLRMMSELRLVDRALFV